MSDRMSDSAPLYALIIMAGILVTVMVAIYWMVRLVGLLA